MACTSCGKKSFKSTFKQASNILKGTVNAIFPNEETRAIAEPRLAICTVPCIYYRELIKINGVSAGQCTECTCVVQSKATIKDEICPKGFW